MIHPLAHPSVFKGTGKMVNLGVEGSLGPLLPQNLTILVTRS